MYDDLDVSLDKWVKAVTKAYPGVKIYRAPEELGGTRDAWLNGEHVGDWDGSGYGPAGRIKKKVDTK